MTTVSTPIAAAPAVPCLTGTFPIGPLSFVFQLHDQSWDCECCGFIGDQELVLLVNGVTVKTWYEDGHFGDSRIDWFDAIALALAYAGARLTIEPDPEESPDVGPYSLLPVPHPSPEVLPLPPLRHRLTWRCATLVTPQNGRIDQTRVMLDDRPVGVWRADEHWDDRLGEHGPVQESLIALGARVHVEEVEQPESDEGNDDENGGEDDDTVLD